MDNSGYRFGFVYDTSRAFIVLWRTSSRSKHIKFFTIIITYALIKLVSLITLLRVDEEKETNGLDLIVHGERAYDVNS